MPEHVNVGAEYLSRDGSGLLRQHIAGVAGKGFSLADWDVPASVTASINGTTGRLVLVNNGADYAPVVNKLSASRTENLVRTTARFASTPSGAAQFGAALCVDATRTRFGYALLHSRDRAVEAGERLPVGEGGSAGTNMLPGAGRTNGADYTCAAGSPMPAVRGYASDMGSEYAGSNSAGSLTVGAGQAGIILRGFSTVEVAEWAQFSSPFVRFNVSGNVYLISIVSADYNPANPAGGGVYVSGYASGGVARLNAATLPAGASRIVATYMVRNESTGQWSESVLVDVVLDAPIAPGDTFSIMADGATPNLPKPARPTIQVLEQRGSNIHLGSSAYRHTDTLVTHRASRWQVAEDMGAATVWETAIADTGEDKAQLTEARFYLSCGAPKLARVQHQGSNFAWSDWSLPVRLQEQEDEERPYSLEGRERYADFNTPGHSTVNLSLTRRPDALSLDYQTAWCIGPEAQGDPSLGLVRRVWRARVVNYDTGGGRVLVSRSSVTAVEQLNGAEGHWEPEVELFSFTGAPIEELDFAFEQNARAVVSAERGGRVWLYWYDPRASRFEFQNICQGRTPRVLLDDPENTDDSDILLVYVSDERDGIEMRQQRELYATPHDTPIRGAADTFVEDVVKSSDYRVRVLYSVRDAVEGTYQLKALESVPYPVRAMDSMQVSQSAASVSAEEFTKVVEWEEGLSLSQSVEVSARDLTISILPDGSAHGFIAAEYAADLTQSVRSAQLSSTVLTHTMHEVEVAELQQAVRSTSLFVYVIDATAEVEGVALTQSVQSITLV